MGDAVTYRLLLTSLIAFLCQPQELRLSSQNVDDFVVLKMDVTGLQLVERVGLVYCLAGAPRFELGVLSFFGHLWAWASRLKVVEHGVALTSGASSLLLGSTRLFGLIVSGEAFLHGFAGLVRSFSGHLFGLGEVLGERNALRELAQQFVHVLEIILFLRVLLRSIPR